MNIKPTIFLTGGGTLGSVTPLLALAEDLQGEFECHFIGTERGVEREVSETQGLIYHGIASGKLRRYWSLWNFIDPIFILYGLIESLFLIIKHKPKLIVSAGSFVSVSVALAGKIMGVKIIILQLDKIPGLANKIMARLSTVVAVTLPESIKDYPGAVLTGCPIRNEIKNALNLPADKAKESFGFNPKLPVILILGGGTGSVTLNKLVIDNLYNLTQLAQVIHLTGKAKCQPAGANKKYLGAELLNSGQMAQAYASADLVISRAGMGAITELSYLSKPTVLIPLPNSHQEANAKYFTDKGACLIINQTKTNAWDFVTQIKAIMHDKERLQIVAGNFHRSLPSEANGKFLELIRKYL